jgi:hypothetical protein
MGVYIVARMREKLAPLKNIFRVRDFSCHMPQLVSAAARETVQQRAIMSSSAQGSCHIA